MPYDLRLFKYSLASFTALCLNICDHDIGSGREEESFLLLSFFLVFVSCCFFDGMNKRQLIIELRIELN